MSLRKEFEELKEEFWALKESLDEHLKRKVTWHNRCAACGETGHQPDMVERWRYPDEIESLHWNSKDYYHPECDKEHRGVEECKACKGKGEKPKRKSNAKAQG